MCRVNEVARIVHENVRFDHHNSLLLLLSVLRSGGGSLEERHLKKGLFPSELRGLPTPLTNSCELQNSEN